MNSGPFWVDGPFEETELAAKQDGNPMRIRPMGVARELQGRVDSVARGIRAPNFAFVNPVFNWARLARRLPVRIDFDHIPAKVGLVAGMTATLKANRRGGSAAGAESGTGPRAPAAGPATAPFGGAGGVRVNSIPHHRRAIRGIAAVMGIAVLLAGQQAAAETTVRLSDEISFQPYVLGQLDEAVFRQSDPGGQSAGFNPRRLRLGGRMLVADQVQFGLVWDFGHLPGSIGALFEAQASYVGLKPFTATVGVFKTGFSLESMQGAGDYLMLERASVVTIARNLAAGIRREGIQLKADGERYNISLAGTAGRAGPGDDGSQRAVVGRIAGLPVRAAGITLHAGISGEWVIRPASSSGARSLSLTDQAELVVDDVPAALSTGRIPSRGGGAVGPELGLSWRRLWLQGEYYSILVNKAGATPGTLHFDGWYGQAAVVVAGRPREWEQGSGAWAAPKPGGKFDLHTGQLGAIEFGARFSTVNLNSRDVHGGRQRVLSAIANWWPIEPLRFSILYEHAVIRGGERPRSFDAIGTRAQVQF